MGRLGSIFCSSVFVTSMLMLLLSMKVTDISFGSVTFLLDSSVFAGASAVAVASEMGAHTTGLIVVTGSGELTIGSLSIIDLFGFSAVDG